MKPWIVVVGGFLGAGKTTLLLAAAEELEKRGLTCAFILNDQGEALVDTEYAALHGLEHGQVTGGCFCCKFSDLVGEMEKLRQFSPDVIFAEPVGSCTDISATMLHPLFEYSDRYRLAPCTVLVDPERARELLGDDADPNLKFLFTKQLQEADVVCFTKCDVNQEFPDIDAQHVRKISAVTGLGITAWLDEILSGNISAGGHVLEIDYEAYARAEAALAWLNLEVDIRSDPPRSSAVILGPLLDQLDTDLSAADIAIVHLKAIIDAPTGFLKVAICGNGQEPVVEGTLDASPASGHHLLLNLRAMGAADRVHEIVERDIRDLDMPLANLRISCFHPAPPKPERRSKLESL